MCARHRTRGHRRAASAGDTEDWSEGEGVHYEDSYATTDDDDLDLMYKFRMGDTQPCVSETVASSPQSDSGTEKYAAG